MAQMAELAIDRAQISQNKYPKHAEMGAQKSRHACIRIGPQTRQ